MSNLMIMCFKGWEVPVQDEGIWFSSFPSAEEATPSWTPEQLIPGIKTTVGPSLALFNGKLYMAWKGPDTADGNIYLSSTDGS